MGSDDFLDTIRSSGLAPPPEIIADGKIHRFSSNGRLGDSAGWYVLHGDGIPAGSFGDWRTGITESWRADVGRALTPQEEAEHRAKVETMRRQRDTEEARCRAEAKKKAAVIWQESQAEPENHPYLRAKGIKSHGARLRSYRNTLVVPVRDSGGDIHSLQFIDTAGSKRFLTSGRVTGCYFSIGNANDTQPLCSAEGFATGATIHEATGYPVAVAFHAGNLEPVAKVLRKQFPKLCLVVCADDDAATAGNPGITKAKSAAQAVGGKVAVPDFGTDRPHGVSDFNDMATLRDQGAVKKQIEVATMENAQADDPIAKILDDAGISTLQPDTSISMVEQAVRGLGSLVAGADDLRRAAVREAALRKLQEIGIKAPSRLLDAATPKANKDYNAGSGQSVLLDDLELRAIPSMVQSC